MKNKWLKIGLISVAGIIVLLVAALIAFVTLVSVPRFKAVARTGQVKSDIPRNK
jgi:hypothetical protein